MNLKIYLIAVMIIPSWCSNILECFHKNISCCDIKTADGFKFPYELPVGREISEISIIENETTIAHAEPHKHTFNYAPEIISMDNSSVVTRDCRDLRIDFLLFVGQYVTDYCVAYDANEKVKTSDPKDLPQSGLIIGVSIVVLCLVVCIPLCCYIWKKYSKHPLNCSCHKEKNSQAERGERKETRLTEIPSDTDQHGSGENNLEKDNTLDSVHVQSLNSTADGRTLQTHGLDHNLNNVEIQLSKNGDLSGPDVNRASNHRAMNRNTRDDPGGVNDTRGQCTAWSSERHGPQDHVNEGQPLLSNQRAAVQGLDMTGEAVPLVNKCGFDPDPVCRCSTVSHDTDVESMTPKMRNHSMNK